MRKLLLLCLVAVGLCSRAEEPLNVSGEIFGTVGDSQLAPYYIMSNCGGVVTQGKTAAFRLKATKDLDLSRRFSYSFGVDAVTGYASDADYARIDADGKPTLRSEGPAAIWLQQLYAQVKYRGVYLSAGMKELHSPLFNTELGSGDFSQSNNARPVPEVRAGFVDFQNIPFTNGWVQIQGEIAYGKYQQDDWLENHYNRLNSFINKGVWTHYKSCYFRTKPSKPFSATVGMQVFSQFGGTAYFYRNGVLADTEPYDVKFEDFFRILTLREGSSDENFGDRQYVYGNTLGSWDFQARYRLRNNSEIKAYFQWPYEDGTGIGKLNGFDGIWGLEYDSRKEDAFVSGAVIEYIDFTNQSGPTHWAPADNPDSSMNGEATGGDNYYNNFRYNSFMNLGMSQGTPFIVSTIYNRNGFMSVLDNRIRGFHVGINGSIYKPLKYRLLLSYRKSWGTYSCPRLEVVDDTSFMLEGIYNFRQVEGLSLKGQFAVDRGNILGNNVGVLLSVSYNRLFDLFTR